MITHVAFVRDHSGSMKRLANTALEDFNTTVDSVKATLKDSAYHDIYASVVECGVGWQGDVVALQTHLNIKFLNPLKSYRADGGRTPLWDSVVKAINLLQGSVALNRISGEGESFLVFVTTDGQDNSSKTPPEKLARVIRELQGTDVWTFVFRVPVGYKKNIVALGIPADNVMEWEQTSEALVKSTQETTTAFRNYFDNRNKGVTSSRSFYTSDLKAVCLGEVKAEMQDITNEVEVARVWSGDDGSQIREFAFKSFGEYKIGCGFYELTKAETIQEHKKIIIKHLKKGLYFTGKYARELLEIPTSGEVRVHPGDHGDFEIYIQSTSVNRKVYKNTNVLYWKNA